MNKITRGSLESLKTVKLLPVGALDRVAYSTEDAEGYEVRQHVEAPCVSVRPGCSVVQALREISGLGLVQVARYAIDGRLELQCFAGSESFYFVRA